MEPFAVIVEFTLHPGAGTAFLPLVTANARTSLEREPGCLRFDVLAPSGGGSDRVVLYEIYASPAAFDAHLATPHFHDFDRATAALVADKRVGRYRIAAG